MWVEEPESDGESSDEDEEEMDEEEAPERVVLAAAIHDVFYLYRTGRRLSVLQADGLTWRLGTVMGVDPTDGRYRVRYDGERLTTLAVAPVLSPKNHRPIAQSPDPNLGEQ